ncbi:MAG: cold shock domain-containing protein, partial [Desulfomonilaceae bacterium]
MELDRCAATMFYVARAAIVLNKTDLALEMVDGILSREDTLAEFYHRAAYTLGVQVCRVALEDRFADKLHWVVRGLEYAEQSVERGFSDAAFTSQVVKLIEEVAYRGSRNDTMDELSAICVALREHAELLDSICPMDIKKTLDWLSKLRQSAESSAPGDEDRADGETRQGIVTKFIHSRGFGFIRDEQRDEEYFFHRSSVAGEFDDVRIQGRPVEVSALVPGA